MAKIDEEKKVRIGALIIFAIASFILIFLAVRGAKEDEQEKYNMVLIPKTIDKGNGFWTSLTDGAILAAKEYGVELQVEGGRSEQDLKGQIQRIEKAIEKKPDAILVAPCSYSDMTDILQEVVDNDIKLVLIDSVIEKDISQGIVATDNYLAGKQLGEYASRYLNQEDEIAIIAHVQGASTAIERQEGIIAGLKDYKDNIVTTDYCGSSYDVAYNLTKEIIEDNPDVNVVFGTNEYASVGAARAVKEMGKKGEVKVFGFDNSIEEIKLLEEGIFEAIIIQKPFNMGFLGVEKAVDIIDGEKIEDYTDSGCRLIDKNNMYKEENQRLLYPFTGQK